MRRIIRIMAVLAVMAMMAAMMALPALADSTHIKNNNHAFQGNSEFNQNVLCQTGGGPGGGGGNNCGNLNF
jgi:hypothetical protein